MEINKLYCIDNVKGMEQLPDEFVDLTVTSPPYDKLRKYNGYSFNFEEVARQLYRVTKQRGVAVWVVGDSVVNGSETGNSFRQALFFMECGFRLHDTMIYKRWSGPLNHNRYEQEFEYMFVLSKKSPKCFSPIRIPCKWYGKDSDRTGQFYVLHDEKNRKLRSGKERNNILPDRIRGNVWEIKNSSQVGERYGHPAPFPEQLAHDHIISWSNVGDLVFDPFVGSGTTAKVARDLGRNYLGFDISQEYIDTANRRLNDPAK